MEALDRLKNWLLTRRRRGEAMGAPAVPSGLRAVNLATARRIIVLFPADRAADRKVIDKWRDAHATPKRHVRILGYFADNVGQAHFNFITLSPAQLSWYGAPKGEAYDTYKGLECDLLLRLGPADEPTLDYLAAVKPAAVKVGPFQPTADFDYDLQYDPTTNTDLSQQLAAIARIFSYTNAITT